MLNVENQILAKILDMRLLYLQIKLDLIKIGNSFFFNIRRQFNIIYTHSSNKQNQKYFSH